MQDFYFIIQLYLLKKKNAGSVYKNSEIPYKPSVYLFICSFFFPM
jgi:hypothetical protein